MKTIFQLSVLILSLFLVVPQAVAETHIYLVRHAEKQTDAGKDPELTRQGHQRANNLASYLADKKIQAIYSSDFKRTQQTAKPLADKLGQKVISYNPRELQAIADKVLGSKQNVLVVGHSNTTPMLAFLLGGDAVSDIDESEYDRIYKLTVNGDKINTQIIRSQPERKRVAAEHIKIDPSKYSDLSLDFQMSFKGKVVGSAKHKINKKNNKILLSEKTVIEAMKINADIKVEANSDNLTPISMRMTGSMGSPVDINIAWHEGKAVGYSEMARVAYKPQGKLTVDQQAKAHVVERSTAIMLAHLVDVNPGQIQTIEWFDSYSAEQKMIEISHQGEAKVTVPAGTFEVIKVRFEGGAPSQMFYITKEAKPKVVKIEVIGMPWVYELS